MSGKSQNSQTSVSREFLENAIGESGLEQTICFTRKWTAKLSDRFPEILCFNEGEPLNLSEFLQNGSSSPFCRSMLTDVGNFPTTAVPRVL
jgi:hypothetical protein